MTLKVVEFTRYSLERSTSKQSVNLWKESKSEVTTESDSDKVKSKKKEVVALVESLSLVEGGRHKNSLCLV